MSYQDPPRHLKWQMPDAQDDLDTADDSHNGDEFGALPPASAWKGNEPRASVSQLDPFSVLEGRIRAEQTASEIDAARQRADARCARCSECDDFALLISGMDEALLKLAGGIIYESNEALREAFSDLMAVRQAMTEAL